MKDPGFPAPEPRPRRSPIVPILIGCTGVLLVGLVLLCGGLGFLAYWGLSRLDEMVDGFATKYEEQGYERVTGQVINVRKPVESPTVFVGQVVKIHADVGADVAIMAQMAEIDSTVNGNVDFFGQMISVRSNGIITGDLVLDGAQQVIVLGTVEGEITGTYQQLEYPGRAVMLPPEAPKPPLRPDPPAAPAAPESPVTPHAPSEVSEVPSNESP